MPGSPARAVLFHTPSGNLFEDSSTIDFIVAGLFLCYGWLTPLTAVQLRNHYQTRRVRLQVKPSLVSKRRHRELLAPARKDGSPCAGKEFVDVLTAIYLKVGESHVRWALVIVLLLQKVDRHLKLLENRFKRPLT